MVRLSIFNIQKKPNKEERFRELFLAMHPKLIRYATTLMGDADEAKDIVSDVFGKAWQEFDSLSNEASAWLYTATRNGCLNRLKHLQVEQSHIEAIVLATQADVDNGYWEHEALLQKAEAIARSLPEPTCTILRLCYWEKKTYREVADQLGISPDTVKKHISKALQILREEKNARISGGLYHETQVRLTYNSNRIEGSRLSEDQTRLIFETNTVGAEQGVRVDDIIETANHFRAIDYIIDSAEAPLSEDIIKTLHKILKTGTQDSYVSWFNVGEYKARPNVVGGQETTPPSRVAAEMKRLLSEYSKTSEVDIRDIIKLHHDFERIHPFQDGNGRVGRLVAFKECLRFNVVPFIIEDSKKMFYYRGLKEWNNEQGFLIETCLDGQDTYKALLDYFGIEYEG